MINLFSSVYLTNVSTKSGSASAGIIRSFASNTVHSSSQPSSVMLFLKRNEYKHRSSIIKNNREVTGGLWQILK
jgi:hypothetical protein